MGAETAAWGRGQRLASRMLAGTGPWENALEPPEGVSHPPRQAPNTPWL